MSVFVAVMAAVGQGRWRTFKSLLVDNTVAVSRYENSRLAMVQAVDPLQSFDSSVVTQMLANAVAIGNRLAVAQAALDANEGMKYHTPIADWLYGMVRPMFDEQFPGSEAYDTTFDSTEVTLGIVATDLVITQAGGEVDRFAFAPAGLDDQRVGGESQSGATDARACLSRHDSRRLRRSVRLRFHCSCRQAI